MYYAIVNKNKLEYFSKNKAEIESYCENEKIALENIRELQPEEVEGGYDGNCYLKGYAPEKPEPTYAELRKSAYPELGEQLDMIWHLMDDGVLGEEVKNTDFYLTLKDVKDKYPKE